jgi:hypothetical protein
MILGGELVFRVMILCPVRLRLASYSEEVACVISGGGSGSADDFVDVLQRAVDVHSFDWFFRCDETTYVDTQRLGDLVQNRVDLIAHPVFLDIQAGGEESPFLLSRGFIERLLESSENPTSGEREFVVREARRLEARVITTTRLSLDPLRYPRADNDVVSAPCSSAERREALVVLSHGTPVAEVEVEHPEWRDMLIIHENGVFARRQGMCAGFLVGTPGEAVLQWFDSEAERLVSPVAPAGFVGDPDEFWLPGVYRVVPRAAVEAQGCQTSSTLEQLIAINEWASLLSGVTGYGVIGVRGALGYKSITGGKVLLRDLPGSVITVSAHAPSRVVLRVGRAIRIWGALNASAGFTGAERTWFSIDGHPLGPLLAPLERTDSIVLAAGEYELRVECGNPVLRHSIWCMEPVPDGAPAEERGGSLAVATVACYPTAAAPEVLWPLARSARWVGHRLRVMGIGSAYGSHADAKIHRLLRFVMGLDADFVLHADGRDSLIVGDREEIVGKFESFNSDFVISMETGCWPLRHSAWAAGFPAMPDGRNWPNAGGWMGTKQGVIRVLKEAIAHQKRLQAGDLAGYPEDSRHLLLQLDQDDQLLLQLVYLEGRRIVGDTGCRIFTNIGTADPGLMDNREYEFIGPRIRLKSSGEMPCVIHFSGPSCDTCRDSWAEWLDDQARKCQPRPINALCW